MLLSQPDRARDRRVRLAPRAARRARAGALEPPRLAAPDLLRDPADDRARPRPRRERSRRDRRRRAAREGRDAARSRARCARSSSARGFQVVLTRDGDRTLTLEERTAIAEGARRRRLRVAARERRAAPLAARHRDLLPRREPRAAHADASPRARTAIARRRASNRCSARSRELRVAEASPQSRRLAEQCSRSSSTGMPRAYRPRRTISA